jgi:hypothetical protein
VTVVPTQSALIEEPSVVTLPRYAKIVGYWEESFFGINRAGAPQSCRSIWVKRERDLVARYLAEAQEEVEAEINYPLGTWRWFQDTLPYTWPLEAPWGWVIEGGIEVVTVIAADEAIDHTTDPAVIGPVATTVTDEDEIHLFYPASLVEEDVEIHPSDIDLDTGAGTVTFQVPRARLVAPAYVDNPRTGLDYTDLANFLALLDVRRVYNDPSTQAVLRWPNRSSSTCLPGCDCPVCSTYTATGCITVRQSNIGSLSVLPATYSGGAWTSTACASCCTGDPQRVTINYRAGKALTRQAEDAVVRLAHAKMPEEPCACELVSLLWKRDRHVPDVVTRERINCRFGLSDGAWAAWQFCQAMKLWRGGRPL